MVKKDFLIGQLAGYGDLEEAFIEKIVNFLPALRADGLDKDYDELFKKTLGRLRKDSETHYRLIQEALDYIKQSQKNEF